MGTKATDRQQMEADVVVVGYGGDGGASAAITAHDNGAKVIIMEKMPVVGRTTRVTGGSFLSPTGMQAVDHITELCQGTTEREIIETFVKNALKNRDWIQEMGGETKAHSIPHGTYPAVVGWSHVVGAETMEKFVVKGSVTGRNADRLWELYPCLVNTQGGPRRDKQARVLNHEGKPIPRLYAAGELGSILGLLYSVSSLTECLAFGRIAGRNAAAEKPWS